MWSPFSRRDFQMYFFNENVWISIKISLKFVADGPINNIPALVQIMAWRQQGAKPLSEAMMVRLPTHICVTRPQWVNSLKPGQNGLHFPDIFKCSFLNENIEIAIKISPKFAPKVPIYSIPALVQVMAWLATSHYLNHWWLVYWCLYVSLSLNELTQLLCSPIVSICFVLSIAFMYTDYIQLYSSRTVLSLLIIALNGCVS